MTRKILSVIFEIVDSIQSGPKKGVHSTQNVMGKKIYPLNQTIGPTNYSSSRKSEKWTFVSFEIMIR